jgi:hypothetical protein
MEAYREIMPGDKLASIIDLPEDMKTSDCEVIVLLLEGKNKKKIEKKTGPFNWKNLPRHKMGKERSSSTRFR